MSITRSMTIAAAATLFIQADANAAPKNDLTPIKIPIRTAIKVANALMDDIEILLDGTDGGGGNVDKKGSYVKIGGTVKHFTLPHLERDKVVGEMRTFINDLKTDIVHAKYLGDGVSRLTVVFESGGKEIKRVCKGCIGNDDKRAKDWDIEGLRLDIDFTLANYRASNGKPSVTFNVKDVQVHADLDVPVLGEKVEEWIVKKIAPLVEKELAASLAGLRDNAANLLWDKLQKMTAYTDVLKARGIPLNITPEGISVSGDQVVFLLR